MSLREYHITTTKELLALNNKVRNLVSHWAEEGRYKEVVLKNVIRRFLPTQFEIGTGFVIKQTDTRGQHLASQQIDLLIYDSASPVLFKEADFVIITADAARAIIEVKANLENQNLRNIIRQSNLNGQFIYNGRADKMVNFFNGVFAYDGYSNVRQETIIQAVNVANEEFTNTDGYLNFKVNHISFNKDYFLKLWPTEPEPHSLYHLVDLSFSFFISNLIDSLSSNSVTRNNFIWFSDDKELQLMTKF